VQVNSLHLLLNGNQATRNNDSQFRDNGYHYSTTNWNEYELLRSYLQGLPLNDKPAPAAIEKPLIDWRSNAYAGSRQQPNVNAKNMTCYELKAVPNKDACSSTNARTP
jgi:hypothetical protein